MPIVRVKNETNGRIVGERIAIADTAFARMRGLLRKRELDSGEGLWISHCSGVHTIGMHFAIDVIGLDKTQRAIKLWRGLVPYRNDFREPTNAKRDRTPGWANRTMWHQNRR